VAFASIILSTNHVAAQEQSGTTLSATKTATGHLTLTFHWTIDKSVIPATWDLFLGDSGTSKYTIAVTKDEGTLEAWVDGEICVTNGGEVATENLQIVDNLKDGVPPPNDVIATVNVDVSSNPVLDPSETGCYDYHVDIPSGNIHPGETYKDTADVTITNHSGWLPGGQNCPGPAPCPFGPSPSATTSLPETPTLINNEIHVDDTNGGSWTFSDDGSATYDKKFTCEGDDGTHDNTATIQETGQSDDASVTVNCYDPSVTKTADTSFTRTYYWRITKTADQTSLTLALQESFLVNYGVTVTMTGYTDSDWAVEGTISIHNPAPIDARINSVSDEILGIGSVSVDCGVSFPYTLPAGETLYCDYSSGLPDGSGRTNTATVTQQNYDYDYELKPTESGTTDFSGSADVTFSDPTTELDKCIDVSDTYAGFLGTVCYGTDTLPKEFTYSRTIGPYDSCGDRTVDNTASFETQDTGVTGSSSWTVNVRVPCSGCTLTLGYWKTHSGFGPQPDVVTSLLPVWLGTSGGTKSIQVTTVAQAVQFLGMRGSNNVFDASNGINKLYAQLLTAKLNIKNGADGSAVASTISSADAFLATHDSTDWGSLTKAQKQQVLGWMTILDNYNNGLIGPGHCSQ